MVHLMTILCDRDANVKHRLSAAQSCLPIVIGSTILGGEADMGDKSVTKVASKHSPKGQMDQKYLASGVHVSMRLWENEPGGEPHPPSQRDYEAVGYVIKGRAELHLEGQKVLLEPGDSWVVPKGSVHTYKILEPFTAVEATYPPAQVHGRDEG
jgi:quercetin dioxygenase-like cupin family protein